MEEIAPKERLKKEIDELEKNETEQEIDDIDLFVVLYWINEKTKELLNIKM